MHIYLKLTILYMKSAIFEVPNGSIIDRDNQGSFIVIITMKDDVEYSITLPL
jgi:hypothetical protein